MSQKNPELPSEKKFGILFFFVFVILGGLSFYRHHQTNTAVGLALVGIVFLVLALLAPNVLKPLNKAWFHLGLLLAKVVNPIVMGVLFFVIITPVAFITKLFGRDALKLKMSKQASYWVERNPVGPDADSFKNQF